MLVAIKQPRIDDQTQQRDPSTTIGGRNEFAQCARRDHEFGAKSDPHQKAETDQPADAWREGRGDRHDAEQREVELIRRSAAEAIAEIAGEARADHHAEKPADTKNAFSCSVENPCLNMAAATPPAR